MLLRSSVAGFSSQLHEPVLIYKQQRYLFLFLIFLFKLGFLAVRREPQLPLEQLFPFYFFKYIHCGSRYFRFDAGWTTVQGASVTDGQNL